MTGDGLRSWGVFLMGLGVIGIGLVVISMVNAWGDQWDLNDEADHRITRLEQMLNERGDECAIPRRQRSEDFGEL